MFLTIVAFLPKVELFQYIKLPKVVIIPIEKEWRKYINITVLKNLISQQQKINNVNKKFAIK